MRVSVPASYWFSAERHELIGILDDKCLADGVALNIFHEKLLAKADGREISEDRLVKNIPKLYLDAAINAGLLIRTRTGKLSVAPFEHDKEPEERPAPTVPRTERIKRLEAIYEHYPKRLSGSMNKAQGIAAGAKKFTTKEQLDQLEAAVRNYAEAIRSGKEDPRYIPMFSTFVRSRWADWVNEESKPTHHNPFDLSEI